MPKQKKLGVVAKKRSKLQPFNVTPKVLLSSGRRGKGGGRSSVMGLYTPFVSKNGKVIPFALSG